jgi:TolB-like protein/Flp pilus assembly protein TadD
MTDPARRGGLFQEMHRRSVWQVVTVYAVGSWFALEVVQGIVEAGNLPDWLPGMALVLLIIGFPMVIATAIIQQGWSRGQEEGSAEGPAGLADGATELADVPAETSSAHQEQGAQAQAPGEMFAEAASSPTPPAAPPSAVHRLFTWRNAIMGGVAAFALWGVVATGLLLSSRGGVGAPGVATSAAGNAESDLDGENPLHSVAVLPFDNLSPDPDNAYFADGVHEDVLTHLSKIGALTVISRTSVMAYRETEKSMSEIAGELGVGAIVEGSVRRAGDDVRITAQLIDARTDEHLWADNFDRQLSAASVFALQTEIAQKIADALAATLTPEEEQRIARSPTESLDALDFYLRGRSVYGRYTPADNEESIRLFQEAIHLDPEYADAWAGLSDGLGQRAFQFGLGREWADSAEAAAMRALELDAELAGGYKALALAYTAQGRVEDALQANLRAVELDPNHLAAIGNVGVHYEGVGRFDEAMRWIQRAGRLDPASSRVSYHVAMNWLWVGELERAEREARQRLRLDPRDLLAQDVLCHAQQRRGDPGAEACAEAVMLGQRDDPEARLTVAANLYLAGDYPRARELAEQAEAEAPDINVFHHVGTLVGLTLVLTGQEEPGRRKLEEQSAELVRRSEASESTTPRVQLAAIEAFLGAPEAALDLLESVAEQRTLTLRGRDLDPAWSSVRDHPRWRALMERGDADLEAQRQRMVAEWGEGS